MLLHRQKLILSLLSTFGGKLNATDFQKYLFLFTRMCENEKSYEFVPYKFGCFSFQAMSDKRKLIEKGYLKDANEWILSNETITGMVTQDIQSKINVFAEKYSKLKGKKLVSHVYKSYPYYAINSEIAEDCLTPEDYQSVINAKPKKNKEMLFATIGYEGETIETYANKLIENNIHTLVDVRKNPISRKYGFSKSTLASILEKLGIEYIHIPALGIDSSDRQELNTQADYDRLFARYERDTLSNQKASIKHLYEIFESKQRIAITCFEKNHCQCHRGRVAKAIEIHSCNQLTTNHL